MTFRSSFGRLCLAASAAALVLVPVALSAQSDDRRRAVGDWLVEDVTDEQGGRTLRMTREEGDYSLDYHLNFSPGGAGSASQGFMVWRLTCGQGGEESLDGGIESLDARATRARIAQYLDRCTTPAAERDAVLRDFDRAFALLAEWAPESQAAALAEDALEAAANAIDAAGAAIENAADMDMGLDMNMTTSMDNDMSMSMDESMTDMNAIEMEPGEETWTNSTTDEPQ